MMASNPFEGGKLTIKSIDTLSHGPSGIGKGCNKPACVATPLWPSVGVKPNTPKVGDLESSGTPECLGFDSKAQNTSH
jgi:hypothetical protein